METDLAHPTVADPISNTNMARSSPDVRCEAEKFPSSLKKETAGELLVDQPLENETSTPAAARIRCDWTGSQSLRKREAEIRIEDHTRDSQQVPDPKEERKIREFSRKCATADDVKAEEACCAVADAAETAACASRFSDANEKNGGTQVATERDREATGETAVSVKGARKGRSRRTDARDENNGPSVQPEGLRKSKRRRTEPARVARNPRAAAADYECTTSRLQEFEAQRIVVFSGSGISVASGMSTFSDPGGLYERARRKYSLTDGCRLFHYTFFSKRRSEAQNFLSGVWSEAIKAKPTSSHKALATLGEQGRLVRHYTMNIDGLHTLIGPRWEPSNPSGLTVEMHGNVNEAVCEDCETVLPMEGHVARAFRGRRTAKCIVKGCKGTIRPRVMFYDDDDEDLITHDFDDTLEEDLAQADLVLWVGISFQQSASVEHFRRVRRHLQSVDRCDTLQVIVNPSDEPLWNLITALSNVDDLNIKQLIEASDDVLPIVAGELPKKGLRSQRLRRPHSGLSKGKTTG